MLGYTQVPYKDFLYVPDNNSSQKIFTFNIKRDATDWHSMNGGGFLFNTDIYLDQSGEKIISGYYVLIQYDGINGYLGLYELDSVNLKSFRDSNESGKLIQKFPFGNVYDEHCVKIVVNNSCLSLRHR